MFSFLLGLAGTELRVTARRALTTVLLFAIGLALLVIAVGGLLFAIYLALAARTDPVAAALIVTAIALSAGAIFVLLAYIRLAKPRRRSYGALPFGMPPSAGAPLGAVPPVGPPGPPLNAKTVVGIAAAAAVIGLIVGRRV